MAEEPEVLEPGAPYPKDGRPDPELVDLKLPRSRLKIGVLTCAGVLFLSAYFLFKLNPDRRFAGEPAAPTRVTVADIDQGKVAEDSHVIVDAEPLMSHAIRTATEKGNIGMRVVPARGSSDKVWLVLPGDGWAEPNTLGYAGRLRPLADLPFAKSIEDFLANNPRPVFATAADVRQAFATSKVKTVSGNDITVTDSVRVAFDLVDENMATVVCSYNERHKGAVDCQKSLTDAGLTLTGPPQAGRDQARFMVSMPKAVATAMTKLESAKLWGANVEPVTQHFETTWGKLKQSAPTGFTVDTATIPDGQLDLIGFYVSRSIPSGAYAVITGEKPQDYWYVLPVTIIVALIALLFAWALVRAIKRDLLPARA